MAKNGKVKIILIIFICIILLSLFIDNNEQERVRIRVISNSNDYVDIYQKEEVKDIVCNIIDADDTKDEVLDKIDEIKRKVNEYADVYNLDIDIEFGMTSFPPKELNGKVISGGEYETLLVTIGKGKGNNYWTILYPEYFGMTFEEVYSGEIEIRSYIYDVIKSISD